MLVLKVVGRMVHPLVQCITVVGVVDYHLSLEYLLKHLHQPEVCLILQTPSLLLRYGCYDLDIDIMTLTLML